jgi:hypothetical protein
MSVSIPADPAPNGYVTFPYEKEAEEALKFFRSEATSTEGWQLIGEKSDVKSEKKFIQGDSSPVPLVRGVGIVKDATPLQLLPIVALPGARLQWDARLEEGHILEKYARRRQEFYTVQKGAFMVQPRDIVGVQDTIFGDDGSIELFQTSIVDDKKAPQVSGKTRATLTVAGWHIKPVGADTQLTYVVKVNPNGSLPSWLVNTIMNESPLLVSKVREYFEGTGYPPLLSNEATSVVRFETFNHDKREWRAGLIGKAGDKFSVVVDGNRFYSGTKYKVDVEGAGKDGVIVTLNDDHADVVVGEDAADKHFELIVSKA